jgi:hypothetical protein
VHLPPAVAKHDQEEIADETEGAWQHVIEFIPFDDKAVLTGAFIPFDLIITIRQIDKADLTGALTGRLTKIDKVDSTGALTGDDYDIMLHCTIGNMRRVDGRPARF